MRNQILILLVNAALIYADKIEKQSEYGKIWGDYGNRLLEKKKDTFGYHNLEFQKTLGFGPHQSEKNIQGTENNGEEKNNDEVQFKYSHLPQPHNSVPVRQQIVYNSIRGGTAGATNQQIRYISQGPEASIPHNMHYFEESGNSEQNQHQNIRYVPKLEQTVGGLNVPMEANKQYYVEKQRGHNTAENEPELKHIQYVTYAEQPTILKNKAPSRAPPLEPNYKFIITAPQIQHQAIHAQENVKQHEQTSHNEYQPQIQYQEIHSQGVVYQNDHISHSEFQPQIQYQAIEGQEIVKQNEQINQNKFQPQIEHQGIRGPGVQQNRPISHNVFQPQIQYQAIRDQEIVKQNGQISQNEIQPQIEHQGNRAPETVQQNEHLSYNVFQTRPQIQYQAIRGQDNLKQHEQVSQNVFQSQIDQHGIVKQNVQMGHNAIQDNGAYELYKNKQVVELIQTRPQRPHKEQINLGNAQYLAGYGSQNNAGKSQNANPQKQNPLKDYQNKYISYVVSSAQKILQGSKFINPFAGHQKPSNGFRQNVQSHGPKLHNQVPYASIQSQPQNHLPVPQALRGPPTRPIITNIPKPYQGSTNQKYVPITVEKPVYQFEVPQTVPYEIQVPSKVQHQQQERVIANTPGSYHSVPVVYVVEKQAPVYLSKENQSYQQQGYKTIGNQIPQQYSQQIYDTSTATSHNNQPNAYYNGR